MSMKDFIDTLSEEQKKALLDALTIKEIDNSVKSEKKEEDYTKKNMVGTEYFLMSNKEEVTPKRGKVQAGKNTWKDTGEDRNIVTPKAPVTPRTRKPPQKKNVKCHICGKSKSINANLLYGEYYRCERCTGSR